MTPANAPPRDTDPIRTTARAIAVAHRTNTARDAAWQRRETALATKARALRALDRTRRRTRRFIQRAVTALCTTPAATPDAALAKLDLAVILADTDTPTALHWALISAAITDLHNTGLTGL